MFSLSLSIERINSSLFFSFFDFDGSRLGSIPNKVFNKVFGGNADGQI